MMRSWIVAGLLCALAAALAAGLTQYRVNIIVTHSDYTETRTIQSEPILTTYVSVADVACLSSTPCKVKAFANLHGVYARDGIPYGLAVICGIVVPFLLLCCSGYFWFRPLSGRARLAVAVVLLLGGILLAIPLAFGLVVTIDHKVVPNEQVEIPQLLLGAATAAALLAGGARLALGARRPRA